MRIAVRKYGGTSLATLDCVRRVARSVATESRRGGMVVVVSARGGTTDQLLDTAAQLGADVATRETDQLLATGEIASAALLATALRELGVRAVSLTGGQAGLRVAGPHGEGRISGIERDRLLELVLGGTVAVVAGFQGVNVRGDVVTLGRGGSDTTAVALAAALGSRRCDIFTDVNGVYTADPRVVSSAALLPEVDRDVMVELAFAGAGVLHHRSIELAAAHGIEVGVRSSFSDMPGTLIKQRSETTMMERHKVTAVALDRDVSRVLIHAERTGVDPAVDILRVLAAHHAPADLVARAGPHEPVFRMGFTMRRSDIPRVAGALRDTITRHGGRVRFENDVAKVSWVGTGMLTQPALTSRALAALSKAGIATTWLSTSQLRSSVTVPETEATVAVEVLHQVFGLNRPTAVSRAAA